jgi:VCBS repeat protein
MKKKVFLNSLRYICLIFVLTIGFITMIGSGGSWETGDDVRDLGDFIYHSVDIADVNNDGHQDIAGARTYLSGPPPHEGSVSLLYQDDQNQGRFPSVKRIDTGGDPICITIGDLNGDGLEDIATANSSTNNISIIYQDPVVTGEFLPTNNISIEFSPSFLKIGDINDDGFNDIIISGSNTSILYQDSNSPGSFLPIVNLNIGSSSVDIGDINGNNYLDLALGGRGLDVTQINLLFQDSLTPGNFLSPVSITVGFQPISIKVKDLDTDGKVDLIVGNYGKSDNPNTGGVSVLIQDPLVAGTFLPRIDYPLGERAEDLAVGDLNNDGFEDIAVANGYTGGGEDSNGSISILFQNVSSLGEFLSPVFYPGIFQPISIAIGDLNGDSFNDIAFGDAYLAIRFQDSTNPGSFKQIIIVDD